MQPQPRVAVATGLAVLSMIITIALMNGSGLDWLPADMPYPTLFVLPLLIGALGLGALLYVVRTARAMTPQPGGNIVLHLIRWAWLVLASIMAMAVILMGVFVAMMLVNGPSAP